MDVPPDAEHLCDPPAEVQPGAQRHQQALPSRGGQGHTIQLKDQASSLLLSTVDTP